MLKRLPGGVKVPFMQHIEELRQRIIICTAFAIVAFIGCYAVSDRLLKPFTALLGQKLVFLTPLEALMAYMSLSFYAAIGLSVPVIAWHAWAFVSPGLHEHENRYGWRVVAGAVGFFAAGVAFCWFLVLPFTVPFLLAYGGDLMTPMISVKAYLNFCLSMLFVFGAVFELPVALMLLHALGLVTFQALWNFQRYWIVVAFIIGAIITPTPDVINQTLASLPLVALYELTLLYIWLTGRR